MNNDINMVLAVVGAEVGCLRRVYMVGGAVRDLAYGKSPKDFDIVLMAREYDSPEVVFEEMTDFCACMARRGYNTAIHQAYEGASSDFDSRIQGLVKVTIGGREVDVMWHHERSIIDLMNTFDFNFNQFFISETDPAIVHGSKPSSLIQLKDDVPAERVAYIKQKWAAYHG